MPIRDKTATRIAETLDMTLQSALNHVRRLEDDLVDEVRLMVFPVVLGTGKRLFGETSAKKQLQLIESKRSATASPSSSTAPPHERSTARG